MRLILFKPVQVEPSTDTEEEKEVMELTAA
jgi:hypothetical protein